MLAKATIEQCSGASFNDQPWAA